MGKGDQKTKKGKIIRGSYGVRRPNKRKVRKAIREKLMAKSESETKKATTSAKEKKKVKETSKGKSATKPSPVKKDQSKIVDTDKEKD